MIYCSYVVACFYPFLHYKLFETFYDNINLNYFLGFFTLLSFDFLKITRLKVCLWIILPFCLVFRNWLMLWTVVATAYQLLELRIPIRNLAYIGLSLVVIQLLALIELNFLGIVNSDAQIVDKTNRLAYDLGLGNSNNVGTTVFYFISLFYLALFKNHKSTFYVIAVIVDFLMFYITSSRTFFFGGLIIISFAFGYQINLFRKWMKYIIGLLPVILISFLIYLIINYIQSDKINEINDLATGRISLFALFFKDFSNTDFLIGKPIELDTPLDNTFLAMLHMGGLIFISFFCLSFFRSITKFYDQLKYYFPFIFGMFAASMTESLFGSPSGAGLILWMITLIIYTNEKKNETIILY